MDTVNAAPYNLDGTGVDVLVYDGGLAGTHTDFGTRLTQADASDISEHATHVAGTVGSSGTNSAAQGGSSLQWRGMAPGVDLISYGYEWNGSGMLFYDNPGDIEHDWAQAQNWYGADLGTASLTSNIYSNYWATWCDRMGNYGVTSVLVDQMARGGNSTVGIGDKYISLWCNGNERGKSTSCDTYRTISPPASAKNPIHVGASNTNDNSMTGFSSWGPTDDGRIKPTIVAGGCQSTGDYGITSTDNDPLNDYTTMCGCSMATPAVAGGIALMLQHYRDIYNTSGTFWPSTAKAILIHTADDFGNPGPDYQWGYGQVDIQAAVDLISRKAFRQGSITHDEVDVYSFVVANEDENPTVTLAWDDFEATFNANPTLINNLDLELESPSGTIVRPWILNPANPANNATRGVDSINNQEQVQIPDGDMEAGTWLVRVSATNIPQGPQDYTLVCEGCQPLDLGVCQDTVATAAAATTRAPEGADLEGGLEGINVPEEESVTVGELWQRALEAHPAEDGTSDTEIALEQLAAAREQGAEAILALAETLTGETRDLAMEDILRATDEMWEAAPPTPSTQTESAVDEATALAVQEASAQASQKIAFVDLPDPAEGAASTTATTPAPHRAPAGPTADLTVGDGCNYATVQEAINAASPGDTILLEGGRAFTENVTIPISLTIRGGYGGCASGSTARTTLDGNATNSVVAIDPGIVVSLESLYITNGNSTAEGGGIRFAQGAGTGELHLTYVDIYANTGYWGGGIWVGPDAEATGNYVNIYENTSTTYGGGVRLFGGRATFTNSNIRDNNASYGGGIYASKENGHTPSINLPTSADVYNNLATTGNGLGGGVYLREGTISLADCSDIYANEALYGGGIYMITGTLTLDGYCSEIDHNVATNNGGGIYAQGSTVNLDDDAELFYNRSTSGSGGGAYLVDTDLWSDRSSIHYNSANGYGGGVYVSDGALLDMDIDNYTCASVRCSRLRWNIATYQYGGGVYATDGTIDLRNTFVELNAGTLGGGIYATSSSVYLYNNVFAGNNATSTAGDGIRLYNNSTLYGQNNTLAYNDANLASTGRAIDTSINSDVTLSCSIIWGHTSSLDEIGHNVTYSDIQGGYAGDGNLAVNPQFVSTGNRDYHLEETSPLVDRCLTGTSPDFENEQRPIVRHTGASPYDMGADEVSGVARVGLNGGTCEYSTIQQAIHAAQEGDTVYVSEGVYFENLSIYDKRLTLIGGYDSTCTVTGTTTTRVDGGMLYGAVVYAFNTHLTLRNLELTWGRGTGAGLYSTSNSRVLLDNVDLFNNHGAYGGGFYVSSSSVVTATNGSVIQDNTATYYGGGGYIAGRFINLGDSSNIQNNCATDGGGLYVTYGDTTLNSVTLLGNQAAGTEGKGGGIYASQGDVSLSNTSLGWNSATSQGGAIYLRDNSTLQAQDAHIGYQVWILSFGNTAEYGGGLYVEDSTVDFEGHIRLNQATYSGGGIYASGATLLLNNTSIGNPYGNRVSTSGYYGAGMYLTSNSRATLSNTVVASNTFQASLNYGGGAYVSSSALTLTHGSEIAYHDLSAANYGRGAGVYINNGSLTLDDSRIHHNTASRDGGGVRMSGTSTLNLRHNAHIRDNQAINETGGGITALNTPDINIENSVLLGNTAGTDGGAIYIDGGTLDFTGGWTLHSNTAGGNGGAIAIMGTAQPRFVADSYSLVYYNHALGGHGGMVYHTNSNTAELYATAGASMYIYANHASENGGALYADNSGFFDIYGLVDFNRNRADSGGAIYLSNNSRVWLDDYSHTAPILRDNWADNGSGGAVYASNSPHVECDGAMFGQENGGNYASQQGGALYLSGSNFDAENCIFRDNRAATDGGAIAAYTSTLDLRAHFTSGLVRALDGTRAPDAPQATACDPATGSCSTFFNNVADSDGDSTGDGGAIYNNDGALTIKHTTLYTNTAWRGGAIFQTGTNAHTEVDNTLIYSNTVNIALGAGIRTAGGTFTLTHVTIANNVGGAGYSQAGTNTNVHNSIAWGNGSGGFLGTFAAATCNIDQSNNAGSTTNPHFADAANQDFHLLGDSPAIDACATGLTPDLDNVIRPAIDAYDMGAFEYPYGMDFVPDLSSTGYPAQDLLYVHTLTNTGGVSDTFAFTWYSSQGWNVTVPALLTLAAGQATPITVTLHVPAGIISGTVDTLHVTVTSQTDPNLTAAVTDTTTIGFAPSGTLTPDYTRTGVGTGTQNYTHILTNTGNAQDNFILTFNSSRGWGNLLTPGPFTLNPGQTTNVIIAVDVPVNGIGYSDLTVVTATSSGGATPVTVHDITTAFDPGIIFTPDYEQAVSPDTIITYTHTLTNTGTSTDTYTLDSLSSMGWATLLDAGSFTLGNGDTATVRVRVVIPAGSAGYTDTTVLTATSAAGAPPVAVHDTTATYPPGVALTPSYTGMLSPGEAITYTHLLTNTGAGPDTIDVALAMSTQGWATLLDPGPFVLSAGADTTVRMRVDAPAGSGGLTEVSILTATSRAGNAAAMITNTTEVPRIYSVALTPNAAQSIAPGTAYTYTHQLINTSNATDTFSLMLSSSRGWATGPSVITATLPAGGATPVDVRVDAPVGSGGLVDIAHLIATSISTSTATARVTDTTTSIYTPGITLIPEYQAWVTPPTHFTYTHWLTNTGSGSDVFALDFQSSQGWATLLEAGPVMLDAGAGISLHVEINVPAGSGGMVETSQLTTTAQTGGISAHVTDVISAEHTFGLELIPDYQQNVPPDTSYIYHHILHNTGNGPDHFTVTLSSSLGWATLLDTGPFALEAGATTDARVSVSVPSGLISGTQSDVAVLTATSLVSPTLSDTATDTTTVGFAPGAIFVSDELTINAARNTTYNYTHWLTNTGNYTDTFTTTFTTSQGWGMLLDTGPFTLGAGESTSTHVSVSVPSDGENKFDTSVITVTSEGRAGPLAVHDTTAAFEPSITLTPEYTETRAPGEIMTYVHTLQNTGPATDVIALTLDSSQGWATLLDDGPHTLIPGESITLSIVVTVPLGTGGLIDHAALTAQTLGGFGPSVTVSDTTTASYTPGVAIGPNFTQTVPAGSAVIYTHYVTNTGNGPDDFVVNLHSSESWSTLLDPGPFTLGAGDSTPVRVEVTVPTDTLPLHIDITTLTATVGALSDTAIDTTTVSCEPINGGTFNFTPSPARLNLATIFTGTTNGSPPITFIWDFGDSSGSQTGNPVAHTFTTTGSFTVTMMAANPCTAEYSATRRVTVYAIPDMTLDPSTLNVVVAVDEVVTRTINLGNIGAAALTWGLVATPTVTWLEVMPISGSIAPASHTPLAARLDATGLAADVYTTTLHLTSNDPDTPLVILPVTLTVSSALPDITVDTVALNVGLAIDHRITRTVTLGNVGNATLDWSMSESPMVDWLTAIPDSGSIASAGNTPVAIGVNATGLVSGTYTTQLHITSNDPDESPIIIPVTLTVSSALPDITLSTQVITASLSSDAQTTRMLDIGNVGTADLSWSLAEIPAVAWLVATPTGSVITPMATQPVSLTLNTTGMLNGTYTTTLRITSNDPESPVEVAVTLIVTSRYIYLPLIMRNF
ncbi:MAG: S8 family serine peptidase [Anaerolineae bacterium]|nr:S8 family serine peptidase [Anaerolineae bacterium]